MDLRQMGKALLIFLIRFASILFALGLYTWYRLPTKEMLLGEISGSVSPPALEYNS
jgi:hypothetical protein